MNYNCHNNTSHSVPPLDSVLDTAYTIHAVQQNPHNQLPESIFSVTVDPNDSKRNRYLICTQSGRVHIINLKDQMVDAYRMIFCIPDQGLNTESREVAYHWDKVTFIPGRPDEVIFLLGISRTIMYSSLSRSSPCDVVELSTHSSRITSIIASDDGQILASGDDRGILKLLFLKNLDKIYIKDPNRKEKIAKDKALPPHLSKVTSYNLSTNIHDGPIFSIQWLPVKIVKESINMYSQSFDTSSRMIATASNDNLVKIWGVSFKTAVGISLTPMISLTLMSANILTLSCHQIASSIFISSSTHTGTICLWKLDIDHLEEQLKTESSAFLHDDGTFLHSISVCSDRPIVGVSMSSIVMESPIQSDSSANCLQTFSSLEKRLVLIASDTSGAIRVFVESDADAFTSRNQKLSFRENFGALTFLAQLQYSLPVVYCGFLYEEECNKILVSTIDGNMQLVQANNLHIRDEERVVVPPTPRFFSNYKDSTLQNEIAVPAVNDDTSEASQSNDVYESENDDGSIIQSTEDDIIIPIQDESVQDTSHSNHLVEQMDSRHHMQKNSKSSLSPQQRMKMLQKRPRIKALPSTEESVSVLSYATLHSTKLYEQQMLDLRRKLESDEISVSTVETTATDRIAALKYIQHLGLPQSKKSNIDDQNLASSPVKVIGKQIDQEWLLQREKLRPTEEEIKLLTPDDPLLKVNMYFSKPDTTRLPILQTLANKESLKPIYQMNIDMGSMYSSNFDPMSLIADEIEMLNDAIENNRDIHQESILYSSGSRSYNATASGDNRVDIKVSEEDIEELKNRYLNRKTVPGLNSDLLAPESRSNVLDIDQSAEEVRLLYDKYCSV